MAILSIPPIPQQNVPPIDSNGVMQADWYRFFSALARAAGKTAAGSTTVAALPAAATAGAGARSFVTDASATTFHSTVAAGGTNKVPVVSDGTNWLIG